MRVILTDKNGDKFTNGYDFKEERKLLEDLIKKGFRPVKGDFFQNTDGHVYKIKWIVVNTRNTITIGIQP